MRLILEYKDYLEQAAASFYMSERADTSTPAVESIEEEEDKQVVMFRRPQMRAKTAAKNTPSKKNTEKTTKRTMKLEKTSPLQSRQI